jgi:hypothetical protein
MPMLDRPWMTALEMQFAALAVVRRLTRTPGVPRSVTDAHVLRCLHRSATFSWSAETSSAIWLASKTIPVDTCFDRDLLTDGIRDAWWWLNGPLPLPMKHPKKHEDDFNEIDTAHICALLLSVDPQGFWTISCGRMSTRQVPYMIEFNQVRVGVSLLELSHPETRGYDPERMTAGPVRPRDLMLFRFVLGASAWLRQRIVTTASGHIERHRRKQLAREYDAPIPSDVKVIELRRAESSPHGSTTASDPVDWACRWIVNGHWRNQPYKDERRLIYINPYLKGPADRPLRVPSHTVYQVDR